LTRRIPYWYFLIIPSLMWAVGFMLNDVVISANNNQMPVFMPGGCPLDTFDSDLIHTCMTHATRLKFLADWLIINGPHIDVASPGDFFMWGGEYLLWPCFAMWVALMIADRRRPAWEI